MNRNKIRYLLAGCAMMLLILDSRQGVLSAAEGVELCIKTVIPSLFPFFVISIFLNSGLSGGRILGLLGKLFSVPEGCERILVSGFLGGYPVGAQAAAQAYGSGTIDRQSAERLLAFCSQAGPSFLFGMIASRFPSVRYAWLLWAVQILSALSVARLIPPAKSCVSKKLLNSPLSMTQAMKKAMYAMASVCGWVILFRVILGFLQRWLLWRVPDTLQLLLCGFLELTNGCVELGIIRDLNLRFLAAALMLNFGGICVMMQTASVTEGLDLGMYVKGKLLQTIFAALYAFSFLGAAWTVLPVLGIAAWTGYRKTRKNSSFPSPVGV